MMYWCYIIVIVYKPLQYYTIFSKLIKYGWYHSIVLAVFVNQNFDMINLISDKVNNSFKLD